MSLLNYTTTIEAEKTIGEIQKILAQGGATAILSEYDEQGYITSLSFKIILDGQPLSFKLPSDWRPVLLHLEKDPKVSKRLRTQEQALRVAWRIIKSWVEAQMAIIAVKMVTIDQVFLPYMVTKNNKTFYEQFKDKKDFYLT